MPFDYSVKKSEVLKNVTSAFLPASVLIPLCQEKNVLCSSIVKAGDVVEEGQVIAEQGSSAKIHASLPGVVRGVKKCSFPDGKCGDAIEISFRGKFSIIGKTPSAVDWRAWTKQQFLEKIRALGIINTFSSKEAVSLASCVEGKPAERIFVRLYDEDPSCQTDSVLAMSEFDKVAEASLLLARFSDCKKIVFAHLPRSSELVAHLVAHKAEQAAEEIMPTENAVQIELLELKEKKPSTGKGADIAARFKRSSKEHLKMAHLLSSSLFVDCSTLLNLYDAVFHNIPSTRVNVHVSGDCLKSSAVLRVVVGTPLRKLAEDLGLSQKSIGKIVVNGLFSGYSLPSLDTPITKYVKSVAFISKHDMANYSVAHCVACGKCREVCPAKIYPDVIFSSVANSVSVPDAFVRSAVLCSECGLCNEVCPVSIPLFQSVKIIKERKDA